MSYGNQYRQPPTATAEHSDDAVTRRLLAKGYSLDEIDSARRFAAEAKRAALRGRGDD